MEIPKNSSRKRGAAIVTDSEAKPTASERAFTEAHDSIVLCDYVSPKRPKRLSVSCVERRSSDSLTSFSSSELPPVSVRVISFCDDNDNNTRKLSCVDEKTGESYIVKLEGIWSSTPLQIGSLLRLVGAKILKEKELLFNWENGVVILESNVLLPCTVIAQGVHCRRKAVFSHYFKGPAGPNKEMVVGSLVHELFQIAVTRPGLYSTESRLLDLWREELHQQHAEQLFALNLSIEEVEGELIRYLVPIVRWISAHMPPPEGRNELLQIDSKVKEVVDVEESIWNSCYGFKAKIDCTLKIETKAGEQKYIPLELKTGKSNLNTEHATQVMLYCLALASRQDKIESGLLLYLLDEISRAVNPSMMDLKGILNLRNEIAANAYAISFDSLPEPLSDTRGCRWCSHALSCSILQYTSGSVVLDAFFKKQIEHLDQNHVEYFKKFARWILMEWRHVEGRNSVDKENFNARQKSRTCLKVFLHSVRQEKDKTVITFEREGIIDEQQESIDKGVMLSVLSVDNDIITVASVIYAEGNRLDVAANCKKSSVEVGRSYLLERLDVSSTFTINLGNLVRLMKDDEHMSKIRSLLIDMRLPKFVKMRKVDITAISNIVKQLNVDQARAVIKSLMAEDFAIIEGFPGSGKTNALVALIRCLLLLGRTVLVTSHTHSAIDNLLSRLVQYVDANDILRLGKRTSVKEALQHLTLEAKLSKCSGSEKVSRMRDILTKTPVVACTCLSVSTNVLFSYRHFSMTFVDEASLVLETTLIPAIAASDSFVLVGDHKQLTPLVRSQQARQEGFAKSLLERLKVHQAAVITLRSQYRMNRPIAELSSSLFYENELRCANDTVAGAQLANLACNDAEYLSTFPTAYQLCVSNALSDAVVFVDTQSHKNSSFRATFGGSGAEVTNAGEAKFIVKLCKLFVKLGLSESDLGVISVYRYHAERLRRMVDPGIEVNTVDQYQGRDKSVIMLSFVWTVEADYRKSELLADFRRVNVAITRAKHKLILVGCRKSLSSCPVVNAVIDALPTACIVVLGES